MSFSRREMYFNAAARSWVAPAAAPATFIDAFHRKLPDYSVTKLISLDKIAKELGFGEVCIKDESSRLGLPSFKILGASWGSFRAITRQFRLPLDSDIAALRDTLSQEPVAVYAATDGNHGRAVARMAKILDARVEIFVPRGIHPDTVELIANEGARVTQLSGSYDDAVRAAFDAAGNSGGILIQDTAFEGYEEIPSKWIVEGYSTMMREIDDQLDGRTADLLVVPVGVGSLAQAVVSHCKATDRSTAVLTVEPETAACLWESLRGGRVASVDTTPTIMAGLDCGTVSSIAWPMLASGVDASLTVSDNEAHAASEELIAFGISAGPCGAAGLAALRRLRDSDKSALRLDHKSTVLLLCTEGMRGYDVPPEQT